MESEKKETSNETNINNVIYTFLTITVIIIILILYYLAKENEKAVLEQNRKEHSIEVINTVKTLSNINVNDKIKLGSKEYVVETAKIRYEFENPIFTYTGKEKSSSEDRINIILTKKYSSSRDDKNYPYFNIVFEESAGNQKCYLKLDWYDGFYVKAEKLTEGLPRNESERKKLAEILKSVKDKGILETCDSLNKNIKL
jgi:hypothetical protein